jgi:organic hydroperoxide reductase OsmC/OhrA
LERGPNGSGDLDTPWPMLDARTTEMVIDRLPASEATTDEHHFDVSLKLDHGYQFRADFGLPGVSEMTLDEPAPLGGGSGPNPARLLAVAVANCLASSLLYCLRKARIEVSDMAVSAAGTMARNEKGRLRVTAINVTLAPSVSESDIPRMGRCLEIYEDFCPVTAAVRKGVDVRVTVEPQAVAG